MDFNGKYLTGFDNTKRRCYKGFCVGDNVRIKGVKELFVICGYAFMDNTNVWIQNYDTKPFEVRTSKLIKV